MKLKGKTIIVVALSGTLVIAGCYMFYKQFTQSKPTEAVDNSFEKPTTNTNSTSTTIVATDWNKILKKGSQGKEVKILQTALKQLTADGIFGDLTEKRLKTVMGVTQTTLTQYNNYIKSKK